jgi:hypothetical protein
MKDTALAPIRHGLADQPDHALARALARSFGKAHRFHDLVEPLCPAPR